MGFRELAKSHYDLAEKVDALIKHNDGLTKHHNEVVQALSRFGKTYNEFVGRGFWQRLRWLVLGR